MFIQPPAVPAGQMPTGTIVWVPPLAPESGDLGQLLLRDAATDWWFATGDDEPWLSEVVDLLLANGAYVLRWGYTGGG